MKDHPIVSVLMTAYNREKYIAESIESILASSFKNFELIIVDDCSTDKTVHIAKEYAAKDDRIKVYVNEKNLGDYPNRNKAASYANGKYIKCLDSDDIIYPHGLEVMVKSMEQFPEAGFGLSAVGEEYREYPVCITPRETYIENFGRFKHFDRAPGSAIIKKDAFDMAGGFTGDRMIGDYQLWFALSRKFSMVKMQRDLYWDRTHSGQERRSEYAKKYDQLRKTVLEKALSDPGCPLSLQEKKEIMRKQKKEQIKTGIKKILRRF